MDVIYNPLRTAFISQALSREIPAVSGLSMLVAQAVAAHEYFFDKPFANRTQVIEDILRQCTARVCNLVLVGMPGSGQNHRRKKNRPHLPGFRFSMPTMSLLKPSAKRPKRLSTRTAKPFSAAGKRRAKGVNQAFGLYHRYRRRRSQKAENRVLLKQNGYVAYIERDVEKLATDGRPLSAGGAERLKKLFEERDGLYKAVADRSFPIRENPGSVRQKYDRSIWLLFAKRKNGG